MLLIDPAWTPLELADLAADLATENVACAFATHAHHDHLLWHPDLPPIPRFASPGTVEVARLKHTELRHQLGAQWPAELAEVFSHTSPVGDELDDWAELIVHDGHCHGHTALYLPQTKVLIAGDMLSDIEIPLPDEDSTDPLGNYRQALELLRPYLAISKVVIPGHGSPSRTPLQRYDADQRYLDALSAGRHDTDPRLHLPDNRQAHQTNLRISAAD